MKEFDNAVESTVVYNVMVQKHNQAVIKLDELQTLQRQVDAQVEDYNRIVLALGRSIAALRPAMAVPALDESELERQIEDTLKEAAE